MMYRIFAVVLFGFLGIPLIAQTPDRRFEAVVGGRTSPDKRAAIAIDFPSKMHRENTSSNGLGLCVFTSMHHAGKWQGVQAITDFPQWMIDKHITGGGHPAKVAELITRRCAELHIPEPHYIQFEGKDLEVFKLAVATGRMPCVTYSFSPTGRYNHQRIAHMVNLVHCDADWVAVLDNNYIGDTQYEWMTPAEFQRTFTGGSTGWGIVFLDAGPPPIPEN